MQTLDMTQPHRPAERRQYITSSDLVRAYPISRSTWVRLLQHRHTNGLARCLVRLSDAGRWLVDVDAWDAWLASHREDMPDGGI
jgi:hypothetical protein